MALSSARAHDLIQRFPDQRILVVGDLILDRYVTGIVDRISPEAPVPVLLVKSESAVPGGASNVAWNVQTLGGQGAVAGLIGDDVAGAELCDLLASKRVGVEGILVADGVSTTVKTRIVADRQQLVRVDQETPDGVTRQLVEQFCERLVSEVAQSSAVIIEDYGKGVVQQQVVDVVLREAAKRGIPTGFDPKENHELNVSGITVATPNRRESFLAADVKDRGAVEPVEEDVDLRTVASTLYQRWKPDFLLLTLGAQGMLVVEAGAPSHYVPTRAREVFDVSGAGDTVIATCMLALAAGATPVEAAELANHAAGVVVAKSGTAPCPVDELLRTLP